MQQSTGPGSRPLIRRRAAIVLAGLAGLALAAGCSSTTTSSTTTTAGPGTTAAVATTAKSGSGATTTGTGGSSATPAFCQQMQNIAGAEVNAVGDVTSSIGKKNAAAKGEAALNSMISELNSQLAAATASAPPEIAASMQTVSAWVAQNLTIQGMSTGTQPAFPPNVVAANQQITTWAQANCPKTSGT